MSEPIYLLLGIHNHQPVGNFDNVFEDAFKKCYWPLVQLLEKYPDVKVALHNSGPLIDWATEHELSYIPTLAKLVSRGQVEILGGGYYEPILPILKTSDALGQIGMMQEFWNRAIGHYPKGMWLAERVWEPSLAKLIREAGLEYTILDDEHFRYSGVAGDPLTGYYRTERAGKSIAVFPTDKTMRYLIPFKPVEDVMGHLMRLRKEHPGCAITYGDDGEKFGMWPGTFEWVIEKGWLEKFFQALTDHKRDIITMHLSEFLSTHQPEGNVYLPTASYHEMLEWAMPANAIVQYEDVVKRIEEAGLMDRARPFIRGGLWDNFLSKYPESSAMHKKAIYISDLIDAAEVDHDMREARESLYRAQCNCAYWHGLFGGLYLNYLRHAVYQNLIDAENMVDRVRFGEDAFARIDQIDLDGDGRQEIAMANDKLIATVDPSRGGTLTELSWRPNKFNLLNTLARRFEAYHVPADKPANHQSEMSSIHDIAKDIGEIGSEFTYDNFPRFSFIEHILKDNSPLMHFGNSPFKVVKSIKGDGFVTTSMVAKVPHPTEDGQSIRLSKTYSLEGKSLSVDYELLYQTKEPIIFVTELNLTLLAGHDPERYYRWGKIPPGEVLMDAQEIIDETRELELVDRTSGMKLNIEVSNNTTWRLEPVETVSQSESGFDRNYQGSNIWILFTPRFSEGNSARFSVCFSFDQL